MIQEEEIDYLLKIIIIGDSGVGKTNILTRFIKNQFTEETQATIGVDFQSVDKVIKDKKVKIQFWDTAGQEKYQSIAGAYYKNAHGAFIVYDITDRKSFEKAQSWLTELKKYADTDINLMLIGNKNDLLDLRQVTSDEGQKFAESQNMFFMEISAKQNQDNCVQKAFGILIKEIFKKVEKEFGSLSDRNLSLNSKSLNFENKKEDDSCCQLI